MAEKVPLWSKELNIPKESQQKAIAIANRFLEILPDYRKYEEKVYAASLLMADLTVRPSDASVKQYQIAEKSGFSEYTIRKYRRKISKTLPEKTKKELGFYF